MFKTFHDKPFIYEMMNNLFSIIRKWELCDDYINSLDRLLLVLTNYTESNINTIILDEQESNQNKLDFTENKLESTEINNQDEEKVEIVLEEKKDIQLVEEKCDKDQVKEDEQQNKINQEKKDKIIIDIGAEKKDISKTNEEVKDIKKEEGESENNNIDAVDNQNKNLDNSMHENIKTELQLKTENKMKEALEDLYKASFIIVLDFQFSDENLENLANITNKLSDLLINLLDTTLVKASFCLVFSLLDSVKIFILTIDL